MAGEKTTDDKAHPVHAQRLDTLEGSDGKQWDAIDGLKDRPPIWVTTVIAVLTFISGVSMTCAAFAIRMALMP